MQEPFKPSLDVTGLSPLRRFIGVLDNYKPIPGKDELSGRDYMSVEFNFKDVEVIEATELYVFPIAQLRIGYSQSASTRWGAFAKSCKQVIGPDADIDQLVGKKQEWAFLPSKVRARVEEAGPDGNTAQVWRDVEQDCWNVVTIEGIAPPEDLRSYLADIADGKTEQAFNQALFADDKFRQRPDLVTALTERKLLDTLLMVNLMRDSEGVLHKVAS